MGEGKAEYQGKVITGKEALEKAGIKPVQLMFKGESPGSWSTSIVHAKR
jgi:histidine ammonia-lyase